MSSISTIPQSQIHNSVVPSLIPDYVYIPITPNQTRDVVNLSTAASSDTITFELSPDSCMNLSKSYLDFDLIIDPRMYTQDINNLAAFNWMADNAVINALPGIGANRNHALRLRNTMNFNSIKVYNKTGTVLCDLDNSYNEYRDLMHELSYHSPDDVKGLKYYDDTFDGCHIAKDRGDGRFEVVHPLLLLTDNATVVHPTLGVKLQHFIRVPAPARGGNNPVEIRIKRHCRFHFADLFNTILSCKSDIYFGETIYVSITFGSISSWLLYVQKPQGIPQESGFRNDVIRDGWNHVCGMSINNPKLYIAYNKSPQCNANTINYVTHHGIDFTDFNIVQLVKDSIQGDPNFSYNFTINSSLGPYVKYILYRCYDNNAFDRSVISFNEQDDRIKWQINDTPCTPDYLYIKKYETYEKLYPVIKGTYYDLCHQEADWYEKFFDVLNFGSDSLTDIKSRAGRDLSKDLKITFEARNSLFDSANLAAGILMATYHHKFYIITGKMLIISARGVEKVI